MFLEALPCRIKFYVVFLYPHWGLKSMRDDLKGNNRSVVLVDANEQQCEAIHHALANERCEIIVARNDEELSDAFLKISPRREQSLSSQSPHFHHIIGASPAIDEVFKLIMKVAETDSTVLILGESGTGKELIAREIHAQSSRKNEALVTVNCAAMPEGLLESEFFGHTKGSFTGATADREGRFSQANRGTIFLDEIADMSLKLQVKLLRVIQERKFEPVGSSKACHVDVRIIAATNRDIEKMVDKGTFRKDLFYRLNVIPICVPPLRDRAEDIPLLINHFLKKYSNSNYVDVPPISKQATRYLCDYHWPGNVRELENLVERVVVLKKGQVVEPSDFPDYFFQENQVPANRTVTIPARGASFKNMITRYEKDLILSALEKTDWNKNRAAQLLGIKRTTLIQKIKKQQIEKDIV
jgi:transcriptional regulator with PAS, ATPase and Fis domain